MSLVFLFQWNEKLFFLYFLRMSFVWNINEYLTGHYSCIFLHDELPKNAHSLSTFTKIVKTKTNNKFFLLTRIALPSRYETGKGCLNRVLQEKCQKTCSYKRNIILYPLELFLILKSPWIFNSCASPTIYV